MPLIANIYEFQFESILNDMNVSIVSFKWLFDCNSTYLHVSLPIHFEWIGMMAEMKKKKKM